MHTPVFTSYFFGPISTYRVISKHDTVLVEASENYQKRSFRNKAIICGSGGPKIITVPLKKGKANQLPITLVEIAYDEDWIGQILKSIKSYYGKAPYFEEIFPDIEDLLGKKHQYLFDLNWEAIQWVLEFIQLETEVVKTSKYLKNYPNMDYRNKPNIKDYASEEMSTYPQIFSDRIPFQVNLSILDLLFCKGPEAIIYLRQNEQ